MYNQAYNRAQLIPMTIRVNEVLNEERLEEKGTDEEIGAYCDVQCDWGAVADTVVENKKVTAWRKYNFEDPKASEHVEKIILAQYNKIKEQEVVLAYVYSRLKLEQTKKALATFTSYFAKKDIKFIQ